MGLWRRRGDPRLLALADQIVVSGCNFGTTVVVARNLEAESFGLFSLAFMTCLFLSNLHRAGLTQPLNVIGSSEDIAKLTRRLSSLLRAQLFVLPLAAIAIAIAAMFLFPDVGLAFAAIAYFTCFAAQETLRRYWYTTAEIGAALRNDSLSYVMQLAALVALAASGGLLGSTAFLAMAVTSLLAFVAGIRRIGTAAFDQPLSTWSTLVEHWPLAKWLLLTVLAVWGAGQAYPLLMVPLGPAAVATFSACRILLNAVGFIVQSVNNYIPTQAAKTLRRGGKIVLLRTIVRTCTLALLAGLAFVLLINLYAEALLDFVYAGRYDHAAPILRVLAWGTVCSYLGAILGAYALAMRDSRSNFLSNLGASIVTFTIGIWLIGAHGTPGAALASVLSLAAAMSLQAMFVIYRLRKL